MGRVTATSTGRGCISMSVLSAPLMRTNGNAHGGAIEEHVVRRVDDPARRRLADDLAELHRAIAFRKILGVAERMHVGHEHRGQLERALAEERARGRHGHAANLHREVGRAREHIERVRIHEAAVVVANVDDDAFVRLVLRVEVGVERAAATPRSCRACARSRAVRR